jgi:hypothetical protein
MTTRLASIIGIFLVISGAYAAEQPTLARVTAYCREEGQLRAAFNGAHLRNGHCAVDPKKIPYGSRILLEGEELIAVDTGPAVVSRKAARRSGRNEGERNAVVIDRYFETKSQAVAWEKSHPHFMRVRVLLPGAALAISEKRPTKDKNLPLQTILATRQVSRSPVLRPAVPIADFYFRAFLESSNKTARDARRRTGGKLFAGNLVESSRGRPVDRFRLLQIT